MKHDPSSSNRSIVAENLHRVRDRIAEAAVAAGRSPDEVTLVGVSKYVDAATTCLLADAGLPTLGEARPQQLWDKASAPELVDARIDWHLIGHLQRNKVRRTLPLVKLVHGVDSERLLRAISDESSAAASAHRGPTRLLLEINISGDAHKHGFTPPQVEELISRFTQFPHVRLCGLMGMAAREGGVAVARQNFAALRELRDQLLPGSELSMGMSGDFEAAIAEGSTIVRVGTALWEGMHHE